MFKKLVLAMILSVIVTIFSPALVFGNDFVDIKIQNIAEAQRGVNNRSYKLNEILVKFKNDLEVKKITLRDDEDVLWAVEQYASRPDVEFAEPNYLVETEAIASNDPYLDKQWYLDKINVREAWQRSSGSPETIIAILDTGVDIDHPDLKDNIWINKGEVPNDGIDNDGNIYVDDVYGWDFVAGDNNPRPDFEEWWFTKEGIDHGTIIAGIAAAVGNNYRGIAGVAWQAKIMPVRVLDSAGSGDVLTVIEGIDYAVEKGADVINLSFIGTGFSKSLFLSLERAYKAGVVVVAAVGNQGGVGQDLDKDPLYPVCYYGGEGENIVMGVAATDKEDKKTPFSNYGTKCVDLAAPGVNFWSTVAYNPGEPGFDEYYSGGWSGSSVAVPLVSGTAALIKSINPSLGVSEIRSLLTANTDNIDSLNPDYKGKLGSGRLNVGRAVAAAYLTVGSSPFSLKRGGILVSPNSAFKPEIKTFKEDSTFVRSFLAYNEKFLGGVNITTADLTGDGVKEIITGAGPGGGPHVRIFQQDGTPIGGFFAYASTFRGGVSVAAGDVDGDGKNEIITGAGAGGGPHVRIFRKDGAPIGSFFAYDQEFHGGISVSAADINGDGRAEIITAPGKGIKPIIRIFDSKGNLNTWFLAFEKDFLDGLTIATGDIDADKAAEIAVGKKNGGSEIRIFTYYFVLKLRLVAYNNFTGGVNLALDDLDGDKVAEIVTGAGLSGGPHVKIFNNKGVLRNEFFAFSHDFKGGINVGIIR